MRQLLIIALIFIGACNQRTTDEELYDQYMRIYYNSWKQPRTKNWTSEQLFNPNIGDTIILNLDQYILTNYSDSVVQGGIGFKLLSGTQIYITDISDHFVEVKTQTDSLGLIEIDRLKDDLTNKGYLQLFKQNYEQINKERIKRVEELMSQNNLSPEDFYNKLAEEHSKRTGKPIFDASE
ncbi:hypothetical protein [Fulvivirga lutea]|uniref:Uncharacterized protein n=1 Tax=Fulvivirga lutea TaxID=2810512 RepID=A0A975A171_9BACT|nr:hypothetical protein [Fulvivirga lutea]QSE97986.1 hypothetical protein JR347_02580 [Fulvivirga lutea]